MRFLLILSCTILILCSGCASISSAPTSTPDSTKDVPVGTQESVKDDKTAHTKEAEEKRMAEEKAKAAEAAKLVFAPTYQSTEDDIYYDAMEIYDSSPTAPQGVYLYQGLVYVIVTIDTNKEKIQYLEGTAMLRVKALLQNKFPSLPENYRLRNKLMEKEFDDDSGIYRYAVVFRLNDIKKLTE